MSSDETKEPLRLNRVQRRKLQRYIAHKASRQMRHVFARLPGARAAFHAQRVLHCPRCSFAFLGSSDRRCQCKVAM